MADQDATDTDSIAIDDTTTLVLDKDIVETEDFRVYDTSPDAVWETGDEVNFAAPITGPLGVDRTWGPLD